MASMKIKGIHYLRGMAAILVLVSHFLNVYWHNNEAVKELLKINVQLQRNKLADFLSISNIDYGGLGVAIFFLISGFVISLSLERYTSGRFILARAFRIFPTYWAALALSILGLKCLAIIFDGGNRLNIVEVLAQALLIRQWFGFPSIDGISWTLEIEALFYLFCAFANKKIKRSTFRDLCQIAIFLVLIWSGLELASNSGKVASIGLQQIVSIFSMYWFLLIWMYMGVVFQSHHRKSINTSQAIFLNGMLLIFCLVFIGKSFLETQRVTYSIAFIIFSLFYIMKDGFGESRFLNFWGDISYPLYAVHPIIGYGVMAVLLEAGVGVYLAPAVAFVVAVGLAFVLHIGVERWSVKQANALKIGRVESSLK